MCLVAIKPVIPHSLLPLGLLERTVQIADKIICMDGNFGRRINKKIREKKIQDARQEKEGKHPIPKLATNLTLVNSFIPKVTSQPASRIITTNPMLHNNISALKRGYKSLKLVSESVLAYILFLV